MERGDPQNTSKQQREPHSDPQSEQRHREEFGDPHLQEMIDMLLLREFAGRCIPTSMLSLEDQDCFVLTGLRYATQTPDAASLATILRMPPGDVRSSLRRLEAANLCQTTASITGYGRLVVQFWLAGGDLLFDNTAPSYPENLETLGERVKFVADLLNELRRSQHLAARAHQDAPAVEGVSSSAFSEEDTLETAEIARRGQELYERQLKTQLETEHWGEYLVINIDTGEYVISPIALDARRQFDHQFPNAASYSVRVGIPLVV